MHVVRISKHVDARENANLMPESDQVCTYARTEASCCARRVALGSPLASTASTDRAPMAYQMHDSQWPASAQCAAQSPDRNRSGMVYSAVSSVMHMRREWRAAEYDDEEQLH